MFVFALIRRFMVMGTAAVRGVGRNIDPVRTARGFFFLTLWTALYVLIKVHMQGIAAG